MNRPACIALGIFLLAAGGSLRAQGVNPRVPPPPPPADPPAAPASTPAAPDSSPTHAAPPPAAPAQPIDPTVPPPPPREEDEPAETAAAPAGPVFDPLHAQRSLDVGKFYLNKGVYDAAIDRFIESANYQPGLATPWRYLGEAYEKKHEYAKAVEAYNKYLDILPHAADAEKVRKTVSDLQEKIPQDSPPKAE